MAEQSRLSCMPGNIVLNILLRLDVHDLLELKCVSKDWRKFISGKDFIKCHLQHVRNNSEQLCHNRLIFQLFDGRSRFSIPPTHGKRNIELFSAYLDPIRTAVEQEILQQEVDFGRLKLTRCECHVVVGSCNGIVCLRNATGNAFMLLNPTTGFRLDIGYHISKVNEGPRDKSWYGFGYESEADDYKVVKVTQSYTCDNINIVVYSWRNKEWKWCRASVDWSFYRLIGMCYGMYYTDRDENYNGTSYKNGLYWFADHKNAPSLKSRVIVRFDLRNDEFCDRVIRLPRQGTIHHSFLTVLNGSLHLLTSTVKVITTSNPQSHWMDVWVMNDHGFNESWRILGKIKSQNDTLPRLVSLSKKRNEVVLHHDLGYTQMYSCDLATGMIKPTQWSMMSDGNIVSQPYIETLVTLQDNNDQDAPTNKTLQDHDDAQTTKGKKKRRCEDYI